MVHKQRKQGRPKAGTEPLTRERILETALKLVDEWGVDQLTMRRLAAMLKVDPMAIYHHLPGKQAVLGGLVEMVFSEFKVPMQQDAPWQERVRAFTQSYRDLTRTHANLVLYLVTDAQAAVNAALPVNEILFRALAAASLSPQTILHAANLIIDYLNGYALAETSGQLEQSNARQEMLNALAKHPPEAFPVMRMVFNSLAADETQDGGKIELEIILAGIEALTRQS